MNKSQTLLSRAIGVHFSSQIPPKAEYSSLPTARPPRLITWRLLQPVLQGPSFTLAVAGIRIEVAAVNLSAAMGAARGCRGQGAVSGFDGADGLRFRWG